MGSLKGRVALVTGGSRGIGAAIARRLATDGASVAISYSASPDRAQAVVRDLEGMGVRAAAFRADQADAKQAAGLIGTVAEKFGRLDILVNNAGVYVGGALGADDVDEAALQRQWAINVHGVAAAVRAAARVLPDGGRIVTIGSCLGNRTPFPGVADYSATKAALAGYTRGWARDLGARGITVNAVQPGPIATEMNPDEGEFAAMLRQATVLGRYGRVEEIAAAVAFLAGPDASYITGTILDVDGGMNA